MDYEDDFGTGGVDDLDELLYVDELMALWESDE